eukprot:scaffold36725_cov61-Phaeocystis_antarctica.AAC.4
MRKTCKGTAATAPSGTQTSSSEGVRAEQMELLLSFRGRESSGTRCRSLYRINLAPKSCAEFWQSCLRHGLRPYAWSAWSSRICRANQHQVLLFVGQWRIRWEDLAPVERVQLALDNSELLGADESARLARATRPAERVRFRRVGASVGKQQKRQSLQSVAKGVGVVDHFEAVAKASRAHLDVVQQIDALARQPVHRGVVRSAVSQDRVLVDRKHEGERPVDPRDWFRFLDSAAEEALHPPSHGPVPVITRVEVLSDDQAPALFGCDVVCARWPSRPLCSSSERLKEFPHSPVVRRAVQGEAQTCEQQTCVGFEPCVAYCAPRFSATSSCAK